MPIPADQGPSWYARAQHSRWVTPASAVGLGLVALVIELARGDAGTGVGMLVLLTLYAAVLLLFGGRSEIVSFLRGDAGDERAGQIQLRALAVTGGVLVPVLVGGYLVALARGTHDIGVWTGLCSLAGITFGVSLAVLSRRS